jgi:hypothetical protein
MMVKTKSASTKLKAKQGTCMMSLLYAFSQQVLRNIEILEAEPINFFLVFFFVCGYPS